MMNVEQKISDWTPLVHSNGTSRESLLKMRERVYDALEAARDALKEMAPNGRDYYLRGPHGMEAATCVHHQRLASLDALQQDIEAEMEQIDQQ